MTDSGDRDRSGRRARRAGGAVLVLFALLLVHNAVSMVENQRRLPRATGNEIESWLHLSSRDIEKVAREHPNVTVRGMIDYWYFLRARIRGAHLTIPDWMSWSRWELERVSGLEVEVAPEPMTLDRSQVEPLRERAEKRSYMRGRRGHRRLVPVYLLRDPAARRYVVAESSRPESIYILPAERYAALRAGTAR